MDEHRHLEWMAFIIHICIVVLNLIALLHNLRKKNFKQVGAHFSVICYECGAAFEHMRDLRGGHHDQK